MQTPEVNGPAAVPLRILLVEDNRDAAETLRMLLEMQGHEVAVAHTGPTGVKAAWIPLRRTNNSCEGIWAFRGGGGWDV